jgi:DNA polymerase-1
VTQFALLNSYFLFLIRGYQTLQNLNYFREVWVVEFSFDRPDGGRPVPRGLVAREYRTGRSLHLGSEDLRQSGPPYPISSDSLFVTYDAPTALGCHLALGWPMPDWVLDLHAEFRCRTSGLLPSGDYSLADALAYFEISGDGIDKLLDALLPQLDLPRALLRGRYTAAVARMEAVGVPIDLDNFHRLREGWDQLQNVLIGQVDEQYRVFDGRQFKPRRWRAWLNKNHIEWPRLASGDLDLRKETFRDMAEIHPQVRPMKELQASLSQLKLFRLAVGLDGRNRCPLRPFASKTGRNQPSTSRFIFGPAAWLRGLIKPREGMALAYIDYEQQEFGIAAALSGDPAMMAAYRSEDPYLSFAKQAGAVPMDATKSTHAEERERFKRCALAVQYGAGAKSLAVRLSASVADARNLLHLHRRTFSTYWEWSRTVQRVGVAEGKLQAAYGWMLNIDPNTNPRTVRNFPLQANGAEMLRLACIDLTERGIRVCAPVHDALLVESPIESIEQVVDTCQEVMQQASALVLAGFPLRTQSEVVRFPDRYMDPRGLGMWDAVMELLDSEEARRSA